MRRQGGRRDAALELPSRTRPGLAELSRLAQHHLSQRSSPVEKQRQATPPPSNPPQTHEPVAAAAIVCRTAAACLVSR